MMLQTISSFLKENQMLLMTALLVGSYFLMRLVNYLESTRSNQVWSKVKPASDLLYSIVHRGVELMATTVNMSSAQKLLKYQQRILEFEQEWKSEGPAVAVRSLAAWLLSLEEKTKGIVIDPSSGELEESLKDSPALP